MVANVQRFVSLIATATERAEYGRFSFWAKEASVSDNLAVYESLAYKRTNRVMDPFLITLPAGVAREEALAHEGEEFLLVQTGRVDFEYDGQTYSLASGDSLYFDASVPHRLINHSKRTAKVLCVFSEIADS